MSETYPGFYRAYVMDARDPRNLRRIRLRIPAVFGDVTTGWAEPLFESLLPLEGSRVWAAFEAGNKDYPLYLGPRGVSFHPATVVAADGPLVQATVPAMFGDVTTEWISPLQNGPYPEAGDSVWVTVQEVRSSGTQPGRQQLLYVNPKVSVPEGGEPDLALAYDAPYKLEWIPRNEHLHDSSAPQEYSPIGHGH